MSETAAVGCRFCSQYSRFWSSFRWSPSAARSDRRESDAAPRTGGRLVMVVIFDGLRHLCGRRIRHFRDRSRRIRPGHLGIIAPVHNPAAWSPSTRCTGRHAPERAAARITSRPDPRRNRNTAMLLSLEMATWLRPKATDLPLFTSWCRRPTSAPPSHWFG